MTEGNDNETEGAGLTDGGTDGVATDGGTDGVATDGETDGVATDGGTDGVATDGETDGVATDGGSAAAIHENTEYLEQEINLFKPSTPFMRDNLRMIFLLFGAWVLFIFGPVTASLVAEDFMTNTTVLGGYPLNFFLTAIVSPLAALVLAAVYAWYRDRLDTKYGITHESQAEQPAPETGQAAEGGDA